MNDFQGFNLPPSLTSAIERMHYTTPTPIQAKVIPLVLEGRDILASSHTGSGKTGAFAIPLVAKMLTSEYDTMLILTPTRELATQVMEIVRDLTRNQSVIRTALLIGGDPIGKQYNQLKSNPRIVVGTPGRVNDHLKRKTLKLHNNKFLVLDETDRMLDMGFGVQIDTILKHAPQARQTLMFSATISKQIERLSKNYLTNPENVKIGVDRAVAPNIVQKNIHVADRDKYETLLKEIESREGSILVFVGTKHGAQKVADRLSADGQEALAIHGDLKQRQRDRVMRSFHGQRNRIMIATDVASRGLDVPHIEHVINYDLPQMAEDYIHRIGRTARAGRSGSSLSFISPKDNSKWRAIERMLKGGEPEPFVKSGSRTGSKFGRLSTGGRDRSSGFKRNDRFGEDRGRPFAGPKPFHTSSGTGFRKTSTRAPHPRSHENGSEPRTNSREDSGSRSSSAPFWSTAGSVNPSRTQWPNRNDARPPRSRDNRNDSSASDRPVGFSRSEGNFSGPRNNAGPQRDRVERNYFTTSTSERSAGQSETRRPFNKFVDPNRPPSRGHFGGPKKPFARKPFPKPNRNG